MSKKDISNDLAATIQNTMRLGRDELGKAIQGGGNKGEKPRKEVSLGDATIQYGKYKSNQITIGEEQREDSKRDIRK